MVFFTRDESVVLFPGSPETMKVMREFMKFSIELFSIDEERFDPFNGTVRVGNR